MIRIITNKRYKEMRDIIREFSSQLSELKIEYDDLRDSFKIYRECKEYDIARLNGDINNLKDELEELKAENKSLKAAKGGYIVQMNKLKKDLEETQKKLEESMTDKYLVKKVPMGKLPKGQVMKMKSHAKQDKIIQKIYEKMEKDEI